MIRIEDLYAFEYYAENMEEAIAWINTFDKGEIFKVYNGNKMEIVIVG